MLVFYYTYVCYMLAFYYNYYEVKDWVKRLRKNGCGDIPEKNQLSTYEQSHQEVVKIEMNSISVPTDMNKNTDTAAMELMIGNMNLRISNETDPLLLAKTIQILTKM